MPARPYRVLGPFEVPFGDDRFLDMSDLKGFWDRVEATREGISTARGVYIFAMRAGAGYTPWYVGKATGLRGFAQEVFAYHKLHHYNAVAKNYRKGTPVLFLVYPVTLQRNQIRRPSSPEVAWVEQHLIQVAIEANPDLRNLQNTVYPRDVQIPGILNAGRAGMGITHFLRVMNRAPVIARTRDAGEPIIEALQDPIVEPSDIVPEPVDVEPAAPEIDPEAESAKQLVPDRRVSRTLEFLLGYWVADRLSLKKKRQSEIA